MISLLLRRHLEKARRRGQNTSQSPPPPSQSQVKCHNAAHHTEEIPGRLGQLVQHCPKPDPIAQCRAAGFPQPMQWWQSYYCHRSNERHRGHCNDKGSCMFSLSRALLGVFDRTRHTGGGGGADSAPRLTCKRPAVARRARRQSKTLNKFSIRKLFFQKATSKVKFRSKAETGSFLASSATEPELITVANPNFAKRLGQLDQTIRLEVFTCDDQKCQKIVLKKKLRHIYLFFTTAMHGQK